VSDIGKMNRASLEQSPQNPSHLIILRYDRRFGPLIGGIEWLFFCAIGQRNLRVVTNLELNGFAHNHTCRAEPRRWVMRDLNGRSGTGRNDLIPVCLDERIAGRASARDPWLSGCLGAEDVSKWGTVIQETLKQLLLRGWSRKVRADMEHIHHMLKAMHGKLPGNQ
jgi:hypothetical protein